MSTAKPTDQNSKDQTSQPQNLAAEGGDIASPAPGKAEKLTDAPTSLTELSQRAHQLYAAQDFEACEQACRAILKDSLDDFNANQLMGVLRARQGRAGEALLYLKKAHGVRPNSLPIITNIVQLLGHTDRHAEMISWLIKESKLRPDEAAPLIKRGQVETQLGRTGEALESYQAALKIEPSNIDALLPALKLLYIAGKQNRAFILLAEAELDEDFHPSALPREQAIAYYFYKASLLLASARALLHNPASTPDEIDEGQINCDEALLTLENLLEYAPAHKGGLRLQGEVYIEQDIIEDAMEMADQLAKINAASQKGKQALSDQNAPQKDKQKEAQNDDDHELAARLTFEGELAFILTDYEKADLKFNLALSLRPDHVQGLYGRAKSLHQLGRMTAAQAVCSRINLAPSLCAWDDILKEKSAALLGEILLWQGNYEEGLRLYEKRRPVALLHREFGQDLMGHGESQWGGQDRVAGRHIVLFSERLVSDFLLFSRYIPLLGERPKSVTVFLREGEGGLARFMQSIRGVTAISTLEEDLPDGDMWISARSLPLLFGTSAADNVPISPLLKLPPPPPQPWRLSMGKGKVFAIALVPADIDSQNAGAPSLADLYKALPKEMKKAAQMAKAGQKSAGKASNKAFTENKGPAIKLFCLSQRLSHADRKFLEKHPEIYAGEPELFENWTLMADLAKSMKLTIGVENPITHCTAMLGRPVHFLLDKPEKSGNWWWGQHGDITPWYYDAKLYRREKGWNWPQLLESLADDLSYDWQDMLDNGDDDAQSPPPDMIN